MALKNPAIATANPGVKANKNYINALYQEVYWRNATQAELNRFESSTVKDAANIILGSANSPFSGQAPQTGSPNIEQPIPSAPEVDHMKAVNDYINSLGGISEAQKQMLRYWAEQAYSNRGKVYSPEELQRIMKDAATNAETDLSPYYNEMTAREVEDLQNQFADIRNQVGRYTQQEQKSYAERLKDTKSKLRASGLTFSGASRRTLGEEGAINSQGIEWEVPQQRRYNVEDFYSGINEKARDAGLDAERSLGSSKVSDIQAGFWKMINPYDGWIKYDPTKQTNLYEASRQWTDRYIGTGDLELERLREIEKSKQDRIKQSLY